MDRRSMCVDYLKGISIFGVVMFHFLAIYLDVPSFIKTASNFGGGGVHVFLICSGFGLALSYHKKMVPWHVFMKKRFFKIYVPYIFIVLVSFFLPYMYMGTDRFKALLSHVFLYKMFIPRYEESFGTQFWFISTIIQFYIVFILIMKFKKRVNKKAFFMISCMISLLWAFATAVLNVYDIRIWNSFFLQYLWEFNLGILLADQFIEKGDLEAETMPVVKLLIVFVLSFAVFVWMAMKGGIYRCFNDVFSVFAFISISLILYKSSFFRKFFLSVHTISYELYLVHILVFSSCFLVWKNTVNNYIIGLMAIILLVFAALILKKGIIFLISNRTISRMNR